MVINYVQIMDVGLLGDVDPRARVENVVQNASESSSFSYRKRAATVQRALRSGKATGIETMAVGGESAAIERARGPVSAGCAPGYYIADIHQGPEGLVAEKCAFDYAGQATNICHREVIDEDGEAWSPPPDPPALAAAERAAAAPLATRPPPALADIDRALASPSIRHTVELCRDRFKSDRATFAFTLSVAPTGELAVEPHDDDGPFTACAARAIRTANLGAYDGDAVRFEQQLVL